MMLEILLARRLLEAAVDPEAPRALAEEAGAELAEIASRNAEGAHGSLPVGNLEGLKSDDLSPLVWLLLLDGRRAGDAEVSPEILEKLFLDSHDPAIRFRLVSGALAQPSATASYEGSLDADFETPPDGNRAIGYGHTLGRPDRDDINQWADPKPRTRLRHPEPLAIQHVIGLSVTLSGPQFPPSR